MSGREIPYFPILVSKISEGVKRFVRMLLKTTAVTPENEHSIKPKNEKISKALESCGFF